MNTLFQWGRLQPGEIDLGEGNHGLARRGCWIATHAAIAYPRANNQSSIILTARPTST